MRTKLRVLLCVPLAIAAVTGARADAVDKYVGSRLLKLHIPGISIAVVRNGRVIKARGYGFANVETRSPATTKTVYEIGSMTKQFTATAVMMLAEEGKLSLDDKVTKFYPDAPAGWGRITVRHLLNHTSGIQNHVGVPGFMDSFLTSVTGKDLPEWPDLLSRFYKLELEFKPGETWAYDNTGYILLGHIIERVSGRGYWQFLDTRIFKPLGMSATHNSDPRPAVPGRASGYEWVNAGWENRPVLRPNIGFSAGSLVSTVEDLAKWDAALYSNKLLKKDSLAQMWKPALGPAGEPLPVNYGFGWAVGHVNGHRDITHSGGTPGFSSTIHRFVDKRLTVIVLTNYSDRITDDIAIDIAGIYDRELKLSAAVNDPDPVTTKRLQRVFTELLDGKPDLGSLTGAMQIHVATTTGKGLPQWYAYHGKLSAFEFVSRERGGNIDLFRYRVSLGESRPYFTFGLAPDGKVAQLYWW